MSLAGPHRRALGPSGGEQVSFAGGTRERAAFFVELKVDRWYLRCAVCLAVSARARWKSWGAWKTPAS